MTGDLYAELYPQKVWASFVYTSPKEEVNPLTEKVDRLGKEMNIKHMEDWYKITTKDFSARMEGRKILKRFDKSLSKALTAAFPHRSWLTAKFKGSWAKQQEYSAQIDFLYSLQKQLKVDNPGDWYRISQDQVRKVAGHAGVNNYFNMLSMAYPNFEWKFSHLTHGYNRKAKQKWLLKLIRKMFASHVHIEEEHHLLSSSLHKVIVDIFIPHYSIAFEYQGEQHYHESIFPESLALSSREAIDAEKADICTQLGIALVPVPYWWSGDTATLIATILQYAPDMANVLPSIKPDTKPMSSPTLPVNRKIGILQGRVCFSTTFYYVSKCRTIRSGIVNSYKIQTSEEIHVNECQKQIFKGSIKETQVAIQRSGLSH